MKQLVLRKLAVFRFQFLNVVLTEDNGNPRAVAASLYSLKQCDRLFLAHGDELHVASNSRANVPPPDRRDKST
jgi:hypothetical protein